MRFRPVIPNRHFIPGLATVEAFYAAASDAPLTAYGCAVLALIATAAGLIHDILSKRQARREHQARARHAELWRAWARRKRQHDMEAGRPDPFPNGLPPFELDSDAAHDIGNARDDAK